MLEFDYLEEKRKGVLRFSAKRIRGKQADGQSMTEIERTVREQTGEGQQRYRVWLETF